MQFGKYSRQLNWQPKRRSKNIPLIENQELESVRVQWEASRAKRERRQGGEGRQGGERRRIRRREAASPWSTRASDGGSSGGQSADGPPHRWRSPA